MATVAQQGYRNEYHKEYQRKLRETGQRLPKIPKPFDIHRRDSCLADFREFCTTYLAKHFKLKWSPNQIYAADKIQTSLDSGDWYAWAMERGGGKSTLSEAGVMWSVLKGASPYVALVLATSDLSITRLENIKTEFRYNQLLAQDFPDAILPFVSLDDEAGRAKGQRDSEGNKTNIGWSQEGIQFAWLDGDYSTCPGAIIEARGLQSSIRGLLRTLPNGESVRPTLVIVDDPQTRQSAKSPSQTQTRMDTLNGDLAYLVGPGESLSVLCPVTVIYEADLADQILNRELHPEWHGVKMRMVEKFPSNLELWDQYADILRTSQKQDQGVELANQFYIANREAMDAGALVSWPENFKPHEVSGIQHAMNLRIRNEASFYAECQNEPIVAQDDFELITADEFCAKTTGHERGVVPDNCSVVTAFTDVQSEHLFWMVCAWAPDFTGYVVDYGAWPDQRRNYFTRKDIRLKLSQVYAGDESGVMFAALTALGKKLCGSPYKKQDGSEIALSRWCIDVGYRPTPISGYANQSEFRNIITTTRGAFVGAKSQTPFNEAERAKKWRTTHGHWFWRDGPGPAKNVRFDANHWKTRVHKALMLPTNSRGSIQLFKANPQAHRMLADHALAEKATKVEAAGRIVYEWTEIAGRDNEGLDNLVGCAVCASICGIIPDAERVRTQAAPALSLADYARMAGK